MAGYAIEELPLYAMLEQHHQATEGQLDLVYEVLAQFVLYGETVEDMTYATRALLACGAHIEPCMLEPVLLRAIDDIHLLTRQEFPDQVHHVLLQQPLRAMLNSFETDIDWLNHQTVAIHAATNAFLSRRVAGGWIRTGRVAREAAECRQALYDGLRTLNDCLTRATELTAALISSPDAPVSDSRHSDYHERSDFGANEEVFDDQSLFDDQSVFHDDEDASVFHDHTSVFDDTMHHTNEFLVIQNPGMEPSVLAVKI